MILMVIDVSIFRFCSEIFSPDKELICICRKLVCNLTILIGGKLSTLGKRVSRLSINVKSIAFMAVVITFILGVSFFYLINRQIGLDQEKKKQDLLTATSMLISGMDYPMVIGEMDQVDKLFRKTVTDSILYSIRLINRERMISISDKSDEVGKKFGDNIFDEVEQSKKSAYIEEEHKLRYYTPLLARAECVDCHDIEIDGVLGVVEMTMATEDIEAQAAYNKMLYLLTLGVLLIAITISLYINIRHNIISPIKAIEETLKDIAQGEGDLTRKLNIASEDEIGRLSGWFNLFIDKIRDIIIKVAGSTDHVLEIAGQALSAAEQLTSGAGEQAEQTSQVSAAIEQMSVSAVESSNKISDINNMTENVAETSRTGSRLAEETVSGMDKIVEASNMSAMSIEGLAERAAGIGEIIKVIDDIADQTNLLALNAAIEAARAGEQGRGFAVVADEVRKLADRTSKATREIAENIKNIQDEVKISYEQVNESKEYLESGRKLVEDTNQSLQGILTEVESVQDMMRQISGAAGEQAEAAQIVAKSVHEVDRVSGNTKENVATIESISEKLNEEAGELKKLVGAFKL